MFRFDHWAVALTIPAVAITALFYLVPLAQVLTLSVTEPTVGFGNYTQLFTSPAVLRVVMTTLSVSLWTTGLAVLASYIAAYALASPPMRSSR
jgi:putative spermidine/putrescine transport system permease protein